MPPVIVPPSLLIVFAPFPVMMLPAIVPPAALLRMLSPPPRLTLPTTSPLFATLTLSVPRSEEHTSELQSLMRISYAVFCLKKKKTHKPRQYITTQQQTKNHTTTKH